jgi:glycosyltransferase involved in cell wall biosynthesis
MILIDALYINMGGGKVLLDYLIESFDQSDLNIHFLLDQRVHGNHYPIKNNKVTYLKSGVKERNRFYSIHKDSFEKALCFASLPPSIRIKAKVYTYFHQLLYLKVPKNSGFKLTLMANLKSIFSRMLKNNTDFWLVQSVSVKSQLQLKYKLDADAIKVIPFYPHSKNEVEYERKEYTYTFASLPASYKNHERLLEAFVLFNKKTGLGELNLTVNDEFPHLLTEIKRLQLAGFPIVNHGFLDSEALHELYKRSEYVVFPSLAESFGLGIIEALEHGCKIIGADLPYMHAVCEPSISFDPLSVDDIVLAFEKSTEEKVKPSVQLAFDEIQQLIGILR